MLSLAVVDTLHGYDAAYRDVVAKDRIKQQQLQQQPHQQQQPDPYEVIRVPRLPDTRSIPPELQDFRDQCASGEESLRLEGIVICLLAEPPMHVPRGRYA